MLFDAATHRRPTDTPRLPAPPPPAFAIAALALSAILAAHLPLAHIPAALAIACGAPTLIWVDLDVMRLPDAMLRPITLTCTAAITIACGITQDWPGLARAITATVIVTAAAAGLALLGPLGLGDVKLVAPLAATTGWSSAGTVLTWLLIATATSALAGLALLALRRADRHSWIPYGPGLLAGWVAAMVLS